MKQILTALLLSLILTLALQACAEELMLPGGLQIIDQEAFLNSVSLEKVTVPEGTQQIMDKAFAGSSVKEAELPASLYYIADNAFDGCEGLIISAPAGSYAEQWARAHGFNRPATPESDFAYRIENGVCIITGYTGNSTEVIVPAHISGVPVVRIDNNAFKDRAELTMIRLPSTLLSIGDSSFRGCSNLEMVMMQEGLENIERFAFYDCDTITAITIPSSVSTIGERAFSNCDAVTSITLQEGLKKIEYSAFRDNRSLLTMKVPDSVIDLGQDFILGDIAIEELQFGGGVPELHFWQTRMSLDESDVPALRTVRFHEGVRVLGERVFSFKLDGGSAGNQYYPNLANIVFPESLRTIGEEAFRNCTSLGQLSLPSRLSVIKDGAFSGCANLGNFLLPERLESIERYAFYDCDTLTAIEIPSSVSMIGERALSNCDSLVNITLQEGLKTIGYSAFRDCRSLQAMKVPDSVIDLGQDFILGDIAIAELEFGGGVPELHYWQTRMALDQAHIPALRTVKFHEGIRILGEHVFSYKLDGGYTGNHDCPNLKSIVFPDSLKSIGEEAFRNCSSLINVDLSHISSLGKGAFRGCVNLGAVIMPESMVVIPEAAFSGCVNLTVFNFPHNLERIDDAAFDGCEMLSGISFSSLPNLWKVGNYAFRNCDLLSVADFQSVQVIGSFAFYDCDQMSRISLPSTTLEIGGFAFAYCPLITTLTIPERVHHVGDYIIEGDSGLTSLYILGGHEITHNRYAIGYTEEVCRVKSLFIGGNITSIGPESFLGWTKLENVVLPINTLKTIGYSAFAGCKNIIGTLVLPKNLTSMDNSAFDECSKWVGSTVVIPYNVDRVEAAVFAHCDRLTTLIMSSKVTSFQFSSIHECGAVELVVPEGSAMHQICIDSYDENSTWSYRTYTDESMYYPATETIYTQEVWDIRVTSDTYKQGDPYRITFNVSENIPGVRIYAMRNSARWVDVGTFLMTADGVAVMEMEEYYTWTIDFTPEFAGALGDNHDVKLRIETLSLNEFATGITSDSAFVKITPIEVADPTIALVVGAPEFVDYRTTKFNITLSVIENEELTEASEAARGYAINPCVSVVLPEGIRSCDIVGDGRPYIVERNVDGCIITAVSLSNAYGTHVFTCTLTYNLSTDADTTPFSETLNFSVGSDNGYEITPEQHDFQFPEGIAGSSNEAISDLYTGHLKEIGYGDNPMDDKTVEAVMYYILTRLPQDTRSNDSALIWGDQFATTVIDYVYNAPAMYRDIYVYSFLKYCKEYQIIPSAEIDDKPSKFSDPHNTLYYYTIYDDISVLDDYRVANMSTWFHESAHAIDYNATSGSGYLTDQYTSGIRGVLTTNCYEYLLSLIENYRHEQQNSIDDDEVYAIIDAIMDYRNKNTQIESIGNGEDHTYAIDVNTPVGLDSRYREDYIDIVEYCCTHMARKMMEKHNNMVIYHLSQNSVMFSDMTAGVTNSAVHGAQGHIPTEDGSLSKYYWYSRDGIWTNKQAQEGWAEFFASVITKRREPDAYESNQAIYGMACAYFDTVIAPEVLSHYRNMVLSE